MYIRGRHFRGFGQVGSQAEITAAAITNAQLLSQGKLQPTKDLGQDGKFAFDPTVPDIIYAVTPYLGNGPGGANWPCFRSIAPAKYQYCGPGTVPWVGTGSDPRPTTPAPVTPATTTATTTSSSTTTTASTPATTTTPTTATSPATPPVLSTDTSSLGSSDYMVLIGGAIGLLLVLLLLKKLFSD